MTTAEILLEAQHWFADLPHLEDQVRRLDISEVRRLNKEEVERGDHCRRPIETPDTASQR